MGNFAYQQRNFKRRQLCEFGKELVGILAHHSRFPLDYAEAYNKCHHYLRRTYDFNPHDSHNVIVQVLGGYDYH